MTALFLSRVRLSRDASAAALAPLLLPDDPGEETAAAHRLVWALFADGPDRQRDFLWRAEGPGRFMTLSARPPLDRLGLFEVQSKPFEPSLAEGDRLAFALRANPVVARKGTSEARGQRHDVVMDALTRLPRETRAEARLAVVAEAGRAWLARQGATHGFRPEGLAAVDGYETMRLPRARDTDAGRRGARDIRYGVLDIEGVLTVLDPAVFLAAVVQGFGRSRAFGCGLMLIRRAS